MTLQVATSIAYNPVGKMFQSAADIAVLRMELSNPLREVLSVESR